MIPIEGGLIVFQHPFIVLSSLHRFLSEKVRRRRVGAFSQYYEKFVDSSNTRKIDAAVAASRLRRSEVRMISRLLPILVVCVASALSFAKGSMLCCYLYSIFLL